jgi:Co/Zn/Cd efflux system component
MARRSEFSVPKMDCPSEERLIRMALEPLQLVDALTFDLPARRVSIIHRGDTDAVLGALEPLKFGAALLESEELEHPVEPSAVATLSDASEAKVLKQILWINALMFVVEGVFGIVAQSTGLLGDSLDMLADALVYGLSLLAVGQSLAKKRRAARLSGFGQLALAGLVLFEVVRRAIQGAEPVSLLIIGVGLLALVANVTCVWLLRRHREGGVHMQASWIFTMNDALVNLGVVGAGALVYLTGSAIPDLVTGTIVSLLVCVSALRILRLST